MKESNVVTFDTSVQQWLHPSMSELASWHKCVHLKLKLKQSNSLRFAKLIIQVAAFVMCLIAGGTKQPSGRCRVNCTHSRRA
jgi:hypothetical protein